MFEIRNLTKEYKDEVIDLWIEIACNEFGFSEWENNIRNMNGLEYHKNNGAFLIAVNIHGELIGTVSLENLGNGVGKLKGFYVKKTYRELKIGSKLLADIFQFAQDNNYKEIILDTYEEFEVALPYYYRLGFEKVGREGKAWFLSKKLV